MYVRMYLGIMCIGLRRRRMKLRRVKLCVNWRARARAMHSRATVPLERARSRRGRLTLTSLIHLENVDYA